MAEVAEPPNVVELEDIHVPNTSEYSSPARWTFKLRIEGHSQNIPRA